jgi:tRNA threonylcarbamoyl adenosine modification protein YeaZ
MPPARRSMPLYLALDTATDAPALALGSPDDPGDDRRFPSRRELSREIERVSAELLAARRVRAVNLAGVVVADGPGSFTGLRIGIAFAKGLCRACGAPLLAAPSLMGAAFAASGGDGAVLVEYDALRGERYRALYRFSAGRVETAAAPARVPADAAAPPEWGALRTASAAHASAAALIRLVALAGGAETVRNPDDWEPRYGRRAEAEVRRGALGG